MNDPAGIPEVGADTASPFRRLALLAAPLLMLGAAISGEASAQERPFWEQNDTYGDQRRTAPPARARRDDAYRPPAESYDGPPGGFGRQAGPDGRPPDESRPYGAPYGGSQGYSQPGGGYAPAPGQGSANAPSYDPRYDQPAPTGPAFGRGPSGPSYGSPGYGNAPTYGTGPVPRDDAYRPPTHGGSREGGAWGNDRQYSDRNEGYGQPYAPPPDQYSASPTYSQDGRQAYGDQRNWDDGRSSRAPGAYSQNEVVDAGHRFFGSISQSLARAIERLFQSQGRPNGYILGEDAGGAFVAGLRYGEGLLYTKDAGNHRVFWQGPSVGYDFGGEGSKTMVLVYNLRNPGDIYERFGGVQGAAYVIGGVSVQFQTHEHVTLAVIRSGVGLRLGANVGYLKYTRTPTWNPF